MTEGMEDGDEAWLFAGNVEFLGPLLATCLHDTPARLQMICFEVLLDPTHRQSGRASKRAMYQCISLFSLFVASPRVVKS